MKIAIAGTSGLAACFARFLANDGNHQFILLSRAVNLADYRALFSLTQML